MSLDLVVGMFVTVERASDAATAALVRYQVELGKMTEAHASALSGVQGWLDYLVAVEKSYKTGVTSLGSYIQTLVAFSSQLSQMFAGATGDAKEALDAIQELIRGMIGSAGVRDTGTGNPLLDQLNRSIADKKKGE